MKIYSLILALVLFGLTWSSGAVAEVNTDGPRMLTEVKSLLAKASNSARIGADERGVWQRDATLGRMRSNTMRQKFKDPLLRWGQIDGVQVNGDEGDWWVQVSSSRLPMFWIRLGSFADKAEAQRLAELITALADAGGPNPSN